MGWFDAVLHSFSTLSLGGFSSHDASFAYFNSPGIEAVAIFFMLIGGINFGTHFLAFRRLSFAPYRRDPEARAYVGLLAVSVLGVAYFLFANHVYPSFWTALRHSAFNVVSVATTAGFASTDFNQWPIFGPGLNQVGPATTYAALSDFQTWVCTVAMLIGRLELFTLFVVVTPAFWRK